MTTIRNNADAVAIIQSDFDLFDVASDQSRMDEGLPLNLVFDDRISQDDLRAVAYDTTGRYTPEQQAAAKHVLENPELFRMLDTASGNSPTGDGLTSSSDVDNAAQDEFLETPGTSPLGTLENPHADSMAILERDFGTFDGAGDDGEEDGQVSLNDLATIAFGTEGDYTVEQRAAARYFLNHLELVNGMDADGDGLFRIEDVRAMATQPAPESSDSLPAGKTIDELANQYAPILYMDPNDGYLLTDPDDYIEGSTVTDVDGNVIDDPKAWLKANPGQTLIIDPGEATKQNPVPDASKTYYEYDPQTNSITYYYFYPNNDGPAAGLPGVGDVQNHEGDWERITVQLDDQFRPVTVYYSAHSGSEGVPWSQVLKEDGRPVAFVATGSHANYFLPGDDYHTEAPGVHDSTVDSPADGLRFDTTSTTLTAIDRDNPPWWYNPNVLWGEDGYFDWTSGPQGPHSGKNTLAPTPD